MESVLRNSFWMVERIVYEFIVLWFGLVYIIFIIVCFIIYDFCFYLEYVEFFCKEIEVIGWEMFEKLGGKCFFFFDSFMKEFVRIILVELVSICCMVFEFFKLLDGIVVNLGEWIVMVVCGMVMDLFVFFKFIDF